MRQYLGPAVRLFLALFVITGFVYPAIVTAIAQLAFADTANGSLMKRDGQIVGSSLLAQKFVQAAYFHPRPSVADYNSLSSGGSNLSPISAKLRAQFEAAPDGTPPDLIFASASGLDPHISVAAARSQVERVARARNLSPDTVLRTVREVEEPRQFRVLGEPRVNVLVLNAKLDLIQKP